MRKMEIMLRTKQLFKLQQLPRVKMRTDQLQFRVISDKTPKRNVQFRAAVLCQAQGREMILVSV